MGFFGGTAGDHCENEADPGSEQVHGLEADDGEGVLKFTDGPSDEEQDGGESGECEEGDFAKEAGEPFVGEEPLDSVDEEKGIELELAGSEAFRRSESEWGGCAAFHG